MAYDLGNLIIYLMEFSVNFYNSPWMLGIKVLAGIYLAVILIDIILLLILGDVSSNVRVGMKGMNIPTVTKSKMQKRWEKVVSRLESDSSSQYKVAIIEADEIADEILNGIGYKGANMSEKLEQVGAAHLDDHLEALKGAHEIRNRIVHEADFDVDKRMAQAVVGVYENFLKYLDFM